MFKNVINAKDNVYFHDIFFSEYENGEKIKIACLNNGKVIELPVICKEIIEFFNLGFTVEEVNLNIEQKYDVQIDLFLLIKQFISLGFVYKVNSIVLIEKKQSNLFSEIFNISSRIFRYNYIYVFIFLISFVSFVYFLFDVKEVVNPTWYFWDDNLLKVFFVNLFVNWFLMIFHELGHYCSVVSFGLPSSIRFRKSLYTYGLVTNVSVLHLLKKHNKVKVLIAGLLIEWLIVFITVIMYYLGFISISMVKVILLSVFMNFLNQFDFRNQTDLKMVFNVFNYSKNVFVDFILVLLKYINFIFGISIVFILLISSLLNVIHGFNIKDYYLIIANLLVIILQVSISYYFFKNLIIGFIRKVT